MKRNKVHFIKTGQALQSLRDSGYSLEAALGEVVDNSIEANANNISLHLLKGKNSENKDCVSQIIMIDDGAGMDENTLHLYPCIGHSSRYMSLNTIGKYGVGAKLSALNFAKRFDVWSRTDSKDSWLHVYFDLDETIELEEKGEEIEVPFPTQKMFPEEVISLVGNNKVGTVVVWSNVDRLEEGRYAQHYDDLVQHIRKELSRIFRYFIDGGIKISVNGTELIAHDPLYLMNNTFQDKELHRFYFGQTNDKNNPLVKKHYEAKIIADETIDVQGFKAQVKITLYPREVIRKRGLGGDKLAIKLRIPDNEGVISFVRMQREVSYTNVPRIFPGRIENPDRFIGIEVSFNPELDDYFGVRNVKRGVEPHGELREKIRECIRKYITQTRKMIDEIWGETSREEQEHYGEHAAVTQAAKNVNISMPKGSTKPTSEKEIEEEYNDLASDVIGDDEKGREEYKNHIKDLPFIVETVSVSGNEFINIKHINNQVVIRLNSRHKFYKEMWLPIKDIAEADPGAITGDMAVKVARRTVEALTLLLIAYGKAESMDDNPDERYRDLTGYWGMFLGTLMGKVKDVV